MMIISTQFEVDTTIRCLVIALFLAANKLRDHVTLTFWPWSVVIRGRSHAQPLHQVWRY